MEKTEINRGQLQGIKKRGREAIKKYGFKQNKFNTFQAVQKTINELKNVEYKRKKQLGKQKYSVFVVIQYVNPCDNRRKTTRIDIIINGRNINDDEFIKRQAQSQFLRNGRGLGDYAVAVINNIEIIEKNEIDNEEFRNIRMRNQFEVYVSLKRY